MLFRVATARPGRVRVAVDRSQRPQPSWTIGRWQSAKGSIGEADYEPLVTAPGAYSG
jgi:hypothetical protein